MPLCMYALRITGDTRMAEDAVQQAMMAVWERLQGGMTPDNVKAYLYRSVRNEALKIVPSVAWQSIDASTVDVTDDTIDTSERDAALWNAVDALPPRCREVFLAVKRDGMSHADIAAQMGISVKTVEAQITKAMTRLREALAPYRRRSVRPFFCRFYSIRSFFFAEQGRGLYAQPALKYRSNNHNSLILQAWKKRAWKMAFALWHRTIRKERLTA